MQITSFRSTYVQQLQSCLALIRKQAKAYRSAKAEYKHEASIPRYARDDQGLAVLWSAKARMTTYREIVHRTCDHYRNLRKFEQWCYNSRVAARVERETSVYAHWSEAGLPTGREHHD